MCVSAHACVICIPGTPSSAAKRSPNSLAHSTQSSIVTPLTGMNGHTSSAPSLGCSPVIKVYIILSGFEVVHIAQVMKGNSQV